MIKIIINLKNNKCFKHLPFYIPMVFLGHNNCLRILCLDILWPWKLQQAGRNNKLNDQEIAEVLTCIRMNFGNNASTIIPQEITEVREMMNP